MAIKPIYATAVALTHTPASLASGSYDASASVDNTSNRYADAVIGGKITTGTSPTSGGVIQVYLYASWDGTVFTAGLSGSDGASPDSGKVHLIQKYRLATIVVDATSDKTYEWGAESVANALGLVSLPPKWGIVIYNGTSVALNATAGNHETKFTGINFEDV